MYYEAVIEGLFVDKESNIPIVLLNTGEYKLRIAIGISEAVSISHGLKEKSFERPLTHDLIKSMLKLFNYKVESLYITKIEKNIFYSRLRIVDKNCEKGHKNIVEIDCRPSDGLGIVSRTKGKILISESVLNKAGIKSEY